VSPCDKDIINIFVKEPQNISPDALKKWRDLPKMKFKIQKSALIKKKNKVD